MADKVRYQELTKLISDFENGTYSADMSEEELPHKVYLKVQMALCGWFERDAWMKWREFMTLKILQKLEKDLTY